MPEFSLQRQPQGLRIISLIPSATELVASLGLGEFLVGRSHECDYPASVGKLPACTAPKFNPEGTSQEVHDRVTDLLQSALSCYQVDAALLQELQPTHILTQAQCEVCAVSLDDVQQAVANLVDSQPQIISLQPNRLADLWADIIQVAAALGAEQAGETLLARLQTRVDRCETLVKQQLQPQPFGTPEQQFPKRPKVACIEWIEPLMAAGNWVPELVDLAGGENLFGEVGKHSPWMEWQGLLDADPNIIVTMPCGFDLDKTAAEMTALTSKPGWHQLKAVQSNQVYLTDGNQYFNRPGPRLVDSLEILMEIFYGAENNAFQRGFKDSAFKSFS